ncbi:hypothetical protein [Streptomyces sp. NPDC014894]|uniref:hypothetical protein n=1 Tax=unclassified Streptomyces TaxID=2593676 RepID=UPI0036FD02DA
MRRRTAAAGVLVSLVLLLSQPGTAAAATGDFSYGFIGLDGRPQRATVHDPASRACVTLPEAADPDSSAPAFAPHNETDSLALVYTNPDCTGEVWALRPHGERATDRLKLRSVLFS